MFERLFLAYYKMFRLAEGELPPCCQSFVILWFGLMSCAASCAAPCTNNSPSDQKVKLTIRPLARTLGLCLLFQISFYLNLFHFQCLIILLCNQTP